MVYTVYCFIQSNIPVVYTVYCFIQSNSPDSLKSSTGAPTLYEIHTDNQRFFFLQQAVTVWTDVKYTTQNVHLIKTFLRF